MSTVIKFTGNDSTGSQPIYAVNLVKHLSRLLSLEVLTTAPQLFADTAGISLSTVSANRFRGAIGGVLNNLRMWFLVNGKYERNDIIIAINPFEAVPMPRFRQILIIHDLVPLVFPDEYPLSSRYYRFVLSAAVKRSRHVVVISESTKKDVMRFFNVPDEKISVVYNGFGNEMLSVGAEKDISSRIEGPYMLYVGGQSYHKNILKLLEAHDILVRDYGRREKLVLAGAFHKRTYACLMEYAKRRELQGRVKFLGPVPDSELKWLYGNARLFVFPSFYEGFGFPPLEAMSRGVPVAASNASSIPEICGDAAHYMNPHRADEMAKSIYDLLEKNQLREELKRKGMERIKKFTWENTARGFYSVISSLQ